MADPVRIAGIGAGYFGQFHYQAWQSIDDAEIVAIVDSDQERAAAAARRHGGVHAYDSVAALLREITPDVVDIVTPPETHLALVSELAPLGIPLICQKPLAPTLEEARKIVGCARENDVQLLIHENFRWQPWYREIRRLIDAGVLGDARNATFRLRPGDGEGQRAYIDRQPYFRTMERFLVHETAIHFIDTFRFLFGDVSSVQASLRRVNTLISGEDSGIILFDFVSGVHAVFDGNRTLDHAADNHRRTMGEFLVEGSEAAIRLDGRGTLHIRYRGEATERPHPYRWQDVGFGGNCVEAFQRHALAVLRGEAASENDAGDYLINLEIEEAIYIAAEEGRRVDVSPRAA